MGIFAALLSAFFATTKDVFSKKLSFEVDGTTSAFASFLFALPFYLVLLGALWLTGLETFAFSGAFFTFVILRSLTDTLAEWMKMSALTTGELSLVSSVLSLYPVILIFISPFITGDELSSAGLACVCLTIVGTIFVVYRPRESVGQAMSGYRRALILSFGSAFFMSLNTCFDRLAVQQASPALSGFVMTLLAALFLWPIWLKGGGQFQMMKRSQAAFWWRGLFEVLFMVAKLTALMFLAAPYVVALQRSSILLNVISGKIVFKEENFGRKMVGALLILLGVVGVVLLS